MDNASSPRARKPGQGSNWIRKAKRLAIYHRDGFCCAYCTAAAEDGARLSLDHVLACELGGTNDAGNLVTSCISCNSAKQHLTMRQWLRYLREQGVDTSDIAGRIRTLTAKKLDAAEGRRLLALRAA